MALIICPECRKEVSDTAAACIHCGYALAMSQAPVMQPNPYYNQQHQHGNNQPYYPQHQYAPPQQLPNQNPQRPVKKKKILPILLIVFAVIVVIIIISSLASHVDKSETEQVPDNPLNTTNSQQDSSDNIQSNSPAPVPPEDVTINIPDGGLIMFDEDDIIVTVTAVNRSRAGHVTDIRFLVENNNDEEISIRIAPNFWSVIQINNLTFSAHFSTRVMPGKRSEERINLDSTETELFDLRNIYSMTIQFQTDEPNDSFMMENIYLYPPSTIIISEQKQNGSFLSNGILVFESDGADVYAFGLRRGYINRADFVVKNKLGHDARFKFGGLSVDGLMSDRLEESEDVYSSTYRVVSVVIDSLDVNEIEFVLREEEFLQILSMSSNDLGIVYVLY